MRRISHPHRFIFFFLAAAFLFGAILPVSSFSEEVVLEAEDGYRISAALDEPDRKPAAAAAGAVLVHMYRHTRQSWRPLISELNTRGITTLAIDLRGHGESRTAPDGSDGSIKVMNRDPEFFNAMHQDAAAAIRYLAGKLNIPAERTALVGASVGCSVAIRAALDNPVAGVVVMTPGRDYLGIPTMDHLKKWPDIPLLILTSEEEADRGAVDIHAALKNRGAELIIFDEESIHGTAMFGEVDGVEKTIADWLAAVFR